MDDGIPYEVSGGGLNSSECGDVIWLDDEIY